MADIKIRKANSVLYIPEEQKDEYVSYGYDVIDERGVTIERATPNDIPTLQARLAEVMTENAKLKKQIEELQAKPKPEKNSSMEIQAEEKPRRVRSKKA